LADESIASYAAAELRRPLIAKIHGGLEFRLKNSTADTSQLPEEWREALVTVFEKFEPIVVGYAGNDGSLMDFLKSLKSESLALNWCLRCAPDTLNETINALPQKVKELLKTHRVTFIPIDGFDQFFAVLYAELANRQPKRFPGLLELIKEKHRQRESLHEKQPGDLFSSKANQTEPGRPESVVQMGKAAMDQPDSIQSVLQAEGARRKVKPWWGAGLVFNYRRALGKATPRQLFADPTGTNIA
jgi:protein O-mannosyl-transferase